MRIEYKQREVVVTSIVVLVYLLYLYRARRVSSINVLLLVRVFFLFILCSDVNKHLRLHMTHLRVSSITLFLTFFRF